MNTWNPIRYRGFWDVPRIFLASYKGRVFLFDCAFDENTEDYPEQYRVYILPYLAEEELVHSWDKLHLKALQYLGEVPLNRIRFDPTRRREIDSAILEELTGAIKVG